LEVRQLPEKMLRFSAYLRQNGAVMITYKGRLELKKKQVERDAVPIYR
jgi:hypothetical protein